MSCERFPSLSPNEAFDAYRSSDLLARRSEEDVKEAGRKEDRRNEEE